MSRMEWKLQLVLLSSLTYSIITIKTAAAHILNHHAYKKQQHLQTLQHPKYPIIIIISSSFLNSTVENGKGRQREEHSHSTQCITWFAGCVWLCTLGILEHHPIRYQSVFNLRALRQVAQVVVFLFMLIVLLAYIHNYRFTSSRRKKGNQVYLQNIILTHMRKKGTHT